LVRHGARQTCSYGAGTTADTIYEIGSLTKLFTGVLLADLVQRGSVELDDPVGALVAPNVVPQHGRPMTLVDLATHRSGLPRMPNNLAPGDPRNPYADYTEQRLFDFLAQARAASAGEPSGYSNLGAALLGVALSRRARQPYAELVEERILQPLGMRRSYFDVPTALAGERAQGHDADGAPQHAWDLGAFAPAGGLHSTAHDMGAFLLAALSDSSSVSSDIHLAMRPRAATRGTNRIGLFFQTREDGSVWHNGGTGGFSSYLALDLRDGVGVCMLLATALDGSDELGDRVLGFARDAAHW
jgi:CubicO group peptidase (beta-lactamase class C family)